MFNYFIYKIGEYLALHLPLKFGYAIAVFISDLRYFFAFRDRRLVKLNLKVIFPEKSDREIRKIRIRVFRNFARYLVDFFRFSIIDKAYIEQNVKIVNLNYLDESIAKGKGTITVTAHIGNWELGGVVAAQSGYPLWAVALPHKHKKVDEFFNYQRKTKGINVVALGKAARACINALKNNDIVALVGDREFSAEGGIEIEFFGKQAIFPKGPAALAIKTGAPVIAGFMLRNKDNSFTLQFEKPIFYAPKAFDKPHETEIKEFTLKIKAIMENYIKKYPEQWYMFRKFWI